MSFESVRGMSRSNEVLLAKTASVLPRSGSDGWQARAAPYFAECVGHATNKSCSSVSDLTKMRTRTLQTHLGTKKPVSWLVNQQSFS